MKKTLLATAIAGALGVTAAAQASTVYDQDGTKLDVYGRLAVAIEGGGDKAPVGAAKSTGTEFDDMGTRLGVRGSQQISSDLSAYGRLELRMKGDQRNNNADIAVRNSYLGLKSNTYGSLQAGNFSSVYLNTVSAPFDVYIGSGLEFAGGGEGGLGDTLAYISPNLEGFQVYLQGKHYTGNGQIVGSPGDNSSTIETAGGAVYEVDALRLGLGYAENSDDKVVGNSGETIFGGTAAYAFTPAFSARLGYETQDNNEDKIGLGATYAMGAWAVYGDYYNISANGTREQALEAAGADTDRNAWALGSTYDVSSNFQVFAEVYESDQSTIIDADTTGSQLGDNLRSIRDNVYWMTGARYFF